MPRSERGVTELVRSPAKRAARRRWPLPVAVGLFLALALSVGRAAGPYLFRVATLESEIATQVRLTTGLALKARGRSRFDLLPTPRITMTEVRVSDPSGSVKIDAAVLRGDVRLLPLLVGRVELAAATLVEPHLAIDLDGRPMPPDSIIGRAMRGRAGEPASGNRRLGAVTLVDGTATLKSRAWHLPTLSDIDATVDWRDLDTAATLTGTMRVGGTLTDVAVWLGQPSALMRRDRSAATLRLRSAPLDLSATGEVDGSAPGFKGHVSATAPSLTTLLALCGRPDVLPAPFADLALNGDVSFGLDPRGAIGLDLSSLHLDADGNSYEGTLAYQGAGTPLLSGTLAVGQLSMAPFLSRLPPLSGPDHAWSRAPIVPAERGGPMRLDLRISASRLRLPPLTVDDAALSVMTRGDRLEIGLNEGQAYGGAIKGRLSLGASADGLSLRGAGSIGGADASALGWDILGRQVASGTLSGSGAFETEGATIAALMSHAGGWARGRAADGDVTGADLGLGLRAFAAGNAGEAAAALRSGRTPFQALAFDLRLADGVATLGEATLQGRDARLEMGGTVDLGRQRSDLHGVARGIDGAAATASLPLAVTGALAHPTFGSGLGRISPPGP